MYRSCTSTHSQHWYSYAQVAQTRISPTQRYIVLRMRQFLEGYRVVVEHRRHTLGALVTVHAGQGRIHDRFD